MWWVKSGRGGDLYLVYVYSVGIQPQLDVIYVECRWIDSLPASVAKNESSPESAGHIRVSPYPVLRNETRIVDAGTSNIYIFICDDCNHNFYIIYIYLIYHVHVYIV